jgi:hypothetical protein
VWTNGVVDATIAGNRIRKAEADFGYGIERGSASIGVIRENEIYGFDTPAASDGSRSAGIYIENSFTTALSGITKSVTVLANDIRGCEYGIWLGNSTDGYAGDVDIAANVLHNRVHDCLEGGILVTDEDKSAGSSVTATFSNNVVYDNPLGYFIYTSGDGAVAASLDRELITDVEVGVYVFDDSAGIGDSTYDIALANCIVEGADAAVYCNYDAIVIDATNNWWGDASGPYDAEGEDETDGATCHDPAPM